MAEQERTPKVLIVDDDPRLRDLLRRYLGDNGFSVSVADGAPAMNRIWMRERFDALILDLMLLGEDEIKVSQYGQWIVLDGIRRGVARVQYRLDSYIHMTRND